MSKEAPPWLGRTGKKFFGIWNPLDWLKHAPFLVCNCFRGVNIILIIRAKLGRNSEGYDFKDSLTKNFNLQKKLSKQNSQKVLFDNNSFIARGNPARQIVFILNVLSKYYYIKNIVKI